MPVGLPGMCLPIWRATICAPIDRLPVPRDPITRVTVLPLKKSACAKADDGSAIMRPASTPDSAIVLTISSPMNVGREPEFVFDLSVASQEHEWPGQAPAIALFRLVGWVGAQRNLSL